MVTYDHFQRQEPRRHPPLRKCPLLEDIERQTHRTVTIKSRPSSQNLAKCAPQFYSPLFRLPAELRTLIFEYACSPYDDDKCRYKEEASFQFYRPEHQARHITSTSLLLTCRLAWLEANHLPLQLGDHSFFFGNSPTANRRPRYLAGVSASEDRRLERFLTGLTFNNREHLKHIHLYGETSWLEEHRYSDYRCVQGLNVAGVCPETLTITVRGGGWMGWEMHRSPLRMNDRWLENLLKWPALPRLREIRLELEVGERKGERRVPELDAIVRDLREKFAVVRRVDHFGTPVCVVLDDAGGAPSPRTWNGYALSPGHDGAQGGRERAVYTIMTLVWKIQPEEEDTSDPATACNAWQQTHYPGLKLPKVSVEGSYNVGHGLWVFPADPAVFSRLEKEWEGRGSLLEFLR